MQGIYYVGNQPYGYNSLSHHGVKGMKWNQHIFGIDANDKYINYLKDPVYSGGGNLGGGVGISSRKTSSPSRKTQAITSRYNQATRRVQHPITRRTPSLVRGDYMSNDNFISGTKARARSHSSQVREAQTEYSKASSAYNNIKNESVGNSTIENLKKTAGETISRGRTFLSDMWNRAKEFATSTWGKIKSYGQAAIRKGREFITKAIGAVTRFAANADEFVTGRRARQRMIEAENSDNGYEYNQAKRDYDRTLAGMAENTLRKAKGAAAGAYSTARRGVEDTYNNVRNSEFGRAVESTAGKIGQGVSSAYDTARRGVETAASTVGTAGKNLYNEGRKTVTKIDGSAAKDMLNFLDKNPDYDSAHPEVRKRADDMYSASVSGLLDDLGNNVSSITGKGVEAVVNFTGEAAKKASSGLSAVVKAAERAGSTVYSFVSGGSPTAAVVDEDGVTTYYNMYGQEIRKTGGGGKKF